MKKGIILNLKRFKLPDYVTHNKIFIVLCILFVAGIVIGSFLLSDGSWVSNQSSTLFSAFLKLHTNKSFISKFLLCIARFVLILMLYFLSGASMLGVIITPFITIWQGIIVGNLTSYVYESYGLNGIAFNALVMLIPISIFTVDCFFSAKYAINFSLNIARLTLPKSRPASLYIEFKNYCSRFLLIFVAAIICSLIEIVLNMLFLKFFNF